MTRHARRLCQPISPRFLTGFLSVVLGLVSAAPLTAQAPSFTYFDPPDAGHGQNQGTTPTCINQSGVIAGWYADKSNQLHGFVRAANGQITEFDPPNLFNTYALAINRSGQIVGSSNLPTSNSSILVGYLRQPAGKFIYIQPAGSEGTWVYGINDAGQVAGTYVDTAGVWHGFLRDATGAYRVLDPPTPERPPTRAPSPPPSTRMARSLATLPTPTLCITGS